MFGKTASGALLLEPHDLLERVWRCYVPSSTSTRRDEASDCYFLSKFNQDSCKRGDELHPILMAAWTKYIQAEHRAFLDKYTDERDAADLVVVRKKYGKALHYSKADD